MDSQCWSGLAGMVYYMGVDSRLDRSSKKYGGVTRRVVIAIYITYSVLSNRFNKSCSNSCDISTDYVMD